VCPIDHKDWIEFTNGKRPGARLKSNKP